MKESVLRYFNFEVMMLFRLCAGGWVEVSIRCPVICRRRAKVASCKLFCTHFFIYFFDSCKMMEEVLLMESKVFHRWATFGRRRTVLHSHTQNHFFIGKKILTFHKSLSVLIGVLLTTRITTLILILLSLVSTAVLLVLLIGCHVLSA